MIFFHSSGFHSSDWKCLLLCFSNAFSHYSNHSIHLLTSSFLQDCSKSLQPVFFNVHDIWPSYNDPHAPKLNLQYIFIIFQSFPSKQVFQTSYFTSWVFNLTFSLHFSTLPASSPSPGSLLMQDLLHGFHPLYILSLTSHYWPL